MFFEIEGNSQKETEQCSFLLNQLLSNFFKPNSDNWFLKIEKLTIQFSNGKTPALLWPINLQAVKIRLSEKPFNTIPFIIQLAHELTHIYIAPQLNGVFIEVLCHNASFNAARKIAEDNKLNWEFENFMLAFEKPSKKESKLEVSSSQWHPLIQTLRQREMERNPFDRNFNNLFALCLHKLLPHNESNVIMENCSKSLYAPTGFSLNELNTTSNCIINFGTLLKKIPKDAVLTSALIAKFSTISSQV